MGALLSKIGVWEDILGPEKLDDETDNEWQERLEEERQIIAEMENSK